MSNLVSEVQRVMFLYQYMFVFSWNTQKLLCSSGRILVLPETILQMYYLLFKIILIEKPQMRLFHWLFWFELHMCQVHKPYMDWSYITVNFISTSPKDFQVLCVNGLPVVGWTAITTCSWSKVKVSSPTYGQSLEMVSHYLVRQLLLVHPGIEFYQEVTLSGTYW